MSIGSVTKTPVWVVGLAKQLREPGLEVWQDVQRAAGALPGRRT